MLKRSNFQGSIRTLPSERLRELLVKCQYRGLSETARAIKREQGRRAAGFARAHNLVLHPSQAQAIQDLGGDISGITITQPMGA